ncbi:MAG: hypothetical protein H5T83_10335, partial [Actinotalea sp.]|nr:hypothetical protein [Actinotalea sp.]
VADAALHAGASRDALAATVGRAATGRGVRRAREVLGLADEGAESAGESMARAALLAVGLPPPETQVRIQTIEGPFWADLGWRQWRVLGEYDGRAKYGRTASDPAALVREKRREDLLRDEGWRVVRLTSRDLADPTAMAARVLGVVPRSAQGSLTPRPFLLAGVGQTAERVRSRRRRHEQVTS